MDYSVVLLAAGSGSRMKLGYNKMFLEIKDQPIIVLSISKFFNDPFCKEIIIVVNEVETDIIRDLLQTNQLLDSRCTITVGGSERQFSVNNGLNHVHQAMVLIHDAARPFITPELIHKLLNETKTIGCAIPAVKVKDTIKVVHNGFIEQTLKRETLVAVQTPQACQTCFLKEAHRLAMENQFIGTDDASLIEHYHLSQVKVIDGSYDNIKITTQEDIALADQLYIKYYEKE
jgi:2-C-methyl-D-erythritol 4-phosphate cytidylyltransferase